MKKIVELMEIRASVNKMCSILIERKRFFFIELILSYLIGKVREKIPVVNEKICSFILLLGLHNYSLNGVKVNMTGLTKELMRGRLM